MIHEHAYLDPTTGGAIQGCEDGFGLLVSAGCEIFEVDEALSSIDVGGDARKDCVVLREQFDGIACNGRQLTQASVQFDERLITWWKSQ